MAETDLHVRTERRLSALETRTAVDEVHRAMVEKRLHSIEDTLKWLVRLVIGALVLGMIAFALRGGLAVA
jgi:hypothetical protein